jgi:predicted secreted hydrolase
MKSRRPASGFREPNLARVLTAGFALLALLLAPAWGFDRALPGYEFQFPRDHFSHPAFQVEWWYYTGNLRTAEGRAFGFELTFFRLGVTQAAEEEIPGDELGDGAARGGESRGDAARNNPEKTTAWDLNDVYLAHFALSDIASGQLHKTERLNRAGPGLAGADLGQARIWNGNWEVRWLEPLSPLAAQKLRAVSGDFSVELELTPAKAPVIHGEDGISQKSAGVGRASHYVSFTRLSAAGTVELLGKQHSVEGLAWMDHEFSTESMGAEQAGWDWMSVQLDNGEELMLYRMRRKDGSADPVSSGTFVDRQGKAVHLPWSEIVMTPGEPWLSPQTGGRYPLRWNVSVPRLQLELECRARFADQEVVSRRELSPTYWEGAVVYEGRRGAQEVGGVGYLEMTGYDKPIQIGTRSGR